MANKRVEYLNMSEKRRLSIGVQLVRESVMVLLDEPTHGLDPLDAYLLVSILSNYAKKTGCGILLSMEKPRSDVFPFLDRALFLCLGGVVYSGSTRGMLEYFHSIGFPCPQLENPLMYYLCLSTVDRRQVSMFIVTPDKRKFTAKQTDLRLKCRGLMKLHKFIQRFFSELIFFS